MGRSRHSGLKHVFWVCFTVLAVAAAIVILRAVVYKTPIRIGSFSFPPEPVSETQTDAEISEEIFTYEIESDTTVPVPPPVDILILVNKENPLPSEYYIAVTDWDSENKVAEIIYNPLSEMFGDMQTEGLTPCVNSAYRSDDDQRRIMGDYINDFVYRESLPYEEASQKALSFVSLPGTSEHGTGLAVDISSSAGDSDMYMVFDWLEKNAYKYGFIKRYPAGKESITGYAEERWHYRYVGVQTAQEIYERGITFEEWKNS